MAALRTLAVAYWLGWQVEANWTDPFLFLTYTLVRPLGGLLILVFMFRVVAGGRTGPEMAFFLIGSAFWPLVLAGMQGMSYAFIDDRERYATLRALYTSPMPFEVYLVGRSLAQCTTGLAAVALTLVFCRVVLHLPLDPATIRWGYTLAAFGLGLVAVIGMGFWSVAVILGLSRESWRLPEAVAGALYLVCGAIFPVTTLPAWLQPVATAIPLTWWLEAMRRGLAGSAATVRSMPWATDGEVMRWLAISTVVTAVSGRVLFALAERRARNLGVLDVQTGF